MKIHNRVHRLLFVFHRSLLILSAGVGDCGSIIEITLKQMTRFSDRKWNLSPQNILSLVMIHYVLRRKRSKTFQFLTLLNSLSKWDIPHPIELITFEKSNERRPKILTINWKSFDNFHHDIITHNNHHLSSSNFILIENYELKSNSILDTWKIYYEWKFLHVKKVEEIIF